MNFRKFIIFSALFSCFSTSSYAASKATVEYIQSSLLELGYDTGAVDGAWGGKTRKALNELRNANGLPELDYIGGSSLYLLHRKAPGSATLPAPGELTEKFSSRAAFLKDNYKVASRHCNNTLNLTKLDSSWTLIKSFTEGKLTGGEGGYISNGEDWFSPISEGLTVSGALCNSGKFIECKKIWNFAKKAAVENSLQTPIRKKRNSEAFDGVAWIGNTVLSSLIANSAIASKKLDISVAEKAPVLDWMYDRVNHFNFVSEARTKVGSSNNSKARNHSMAAVLPSMLLGAWLGDRELYDRGKPQYQYALDNMRKDGSFPTETRRGSRALAYTGLQISYLTAMAEIAVAQGDDFYSLNSRSDKNLHDAVDFNVKGWEDWNNVVLPYAKANHAAPKTPSSPMATAFEIYHGWLPAYEHRFPTHKNISLMKEAVIDPSVCSEKHMGEGRSDEWWCRKLPKPVPFVEMLQPDGSQIAISSHHMGFNAGCLISESETVLK